MRDTGNSFTLRLVALGIAAALGSTAVTAQPRDPSPIERDRAAIPDQPPDADADRGAQQKDADGRAARGSANARAAQDDAHTAADLQRQAGIAARDGELETKPRAARSDEANGAATFAAVANERGDLGTFIAALEATGLDDTLANGTEYTVFAPTNEAFAKLDQSREELLDPDNREELVALLRAHIVADDVDAKLVRELDQAMTVDGGKLELSSHGEALMVGDARIVRTDVMRGNLRVYGIDKVQEPNAPADVAAASLAGRDDTLAAAGNDARSELRAATVEPRGDRSSAAPRATRDVAPARSQSAPAERPDAASEGSQDRDRDFGTRRESGRSEGSIEPRSN